MIALSFFITFLTLLFSNNKIYTQFLIRKNNMNQIIKKILLFLFLMHNINYVYAAGVKIVPFIVTKHAGLLAHCAQQHFQHLFTSSPLDPIGQCPSKRFAYGLAQAGQIGMDCDEFGQFKNKNDQSISTVKVLELENNPIGYIKQTVNIPNNKSIAKIDQLALLKEYKNKGFAQLLIFNAFDLFITDPLIQYVMVTTTTTKELGEKFYHKKLGFTFLCDDISATHPDETLYIWVAKIRS